MSASWSRRDVFISAWNLVNDKYGCSVVAWNLSNVSLHIPRVIRMGVSLNVLIFISHWYSNQRQSTHFLTKARTHLAVLISLTIAVLGNIFPTFLDSFFFTLIGRDSWQVCKWFLNILSFISALLTVVSWIPYPYFSGWQSQSASIVHSSTFQPLLTPWCSCGFLNSHYCSNCCVDQYP